MIIPVSVIHQVSWMGVLKNLLAQNTTSGGRGPPTLRMWRRLLRSHCSAISFSCSIILIKTVGEEYQTVIRCDSMERHHPSSPNLPPRTKLSTPQSQGAKTPYTVPVIHPGSDVVHRRSSSRRSRTHRAVIRYPTISPWTWRTPLGSPVEPEV